MSVSEIIGGLPVISSVLDHGPLVAAFATFFVMFGVTYPLICWEWGYWLPLRRLYLNFLVCDAFVYPGYMAVAASVLADADPGNFWASSSWHWSVLILGTVLSLAVCWWEMRIEKYPLDVQLEPWKIWHTLTFPIAFYWIVSTLPIVLLQGKLWAICAVVSGALLFLATSVLDGWLPGTQKAQRRLMQVLSSIGVL
ncbi:MAG TPA: hypothetical protein VG984_02115 [Candidatus Paceibacterota bacterium]|nr:hypothetical protein [Candidatus Paceibacterota bacterium]